MKIAVMGGAGDQGRVSVADLAAQDDVESVIIADIAPDKAEVVAKEIGSDKIVVEKVDVFDPASLERVLGQVDVVVNTTGPFFVMGDRVARAAIKAKVGYVDICDDPEPTVALLDLHAEAEAAGVTLIIGLGCTPGSTNLMARSATNHMDKVDEIRVGWIGKLEGIAGEAVIHHGIHMLSEPLPQYLDGAVVNVEPFTGDEVKSFVSYGDSNTIYVKHPEPVTLYRYIDGVKNVTCKANAYPSEVFGLDTVWKETFASGMLSTDEIPVKGTMISPRDFTIAMLLATQEPLAGEKSDETLELLVEVDGEKDGKKAQYKAYLADTLERATGIPASIGALMIGRGQIRAKGSFAPEGCVEPAPFFEELSKRGMKLFKEEFPAQG